MHQLCFDIHHLVLTTAKCQPVVPPPRKYNAGNIFRSQSFKRTANFLRMCVCVWECSFPVNKLNELLTLQKRSPNPLQQKRHQIVWYTTGSTHWTEARIITTLVMPIIELENSRGLTLSSQPGSMSSDSANIILSMSIKDDVYSAGEWWQVSGYSF